MTELACNFQRSFMTWDKPRRKDDPRPNVRHNTPLGNRARIQLESLLQITHRDSGETEEFFLIAPCRTEWVYAEKQMFQLPSGEFRCIYSLDRERAVGRRLLWDGKQVPSHPADGWDLDIDVQRFAKTETHATTAEIAAATARNVPLVGRTWLDHPDGDYRCLLEYPIKTMNFRPETPSFQVDTGPLIVPDFGSTAELLIDRLEMAHIAYNRPDHAELILRRPTPISDQPGAPTTLHYSEVREYAAENQILSGEA